jgi:hypothetical protein
MKSFAQLAAQFAPRRQLEATISTRLEVPEHFMVCFNQELVAEI